SPYWTVTAALGGLAPLAVFMVSARPSPSMVHTCWFVGVLFVVVKRKNIMRIRKFMRILQITNNANLLAL
ncbi:hypothetical protein L6248_00360, partial [Candidatus Parcubacteria bacterium]|nr:hypothetical protein [Candidatus Parcubacteria bacterium]